MTSVCLPFSGTGIGFCRLLPLHLIDQSRRWPPTSLTAKSTLRNLVPHISSSSRRRRRHRRLSISASMSHPSSMESNAALWMIPLHRCKTIHLVRHAQGHHNVEGEKDVEAYMKPEYFDAALTTLGWQQVDNLRKHVHSSGLFKGIELVIVSPMMRTLQTAVGVFGTEGYADRTDIPLLMVENAGDSNRSAISSLNSPPIVAVELCREHLGVRPCDKRRNVKEYQPLFPAVDFSLIESEEDVWWKAEIRETKEEIAARGLKFVNWLWTRKEKEIAIVTHSAFLFHTLSQFGNDNQLMMKDEMCKRFTNCEVRSMVIMDRSMVGLDPLSTTNYAGKIPDGLDAGSDTIDGKKLKKDS